MLKSNLRIFFRSLLTAYLFTALLLLFLAFGLYQFQLSEKQITLGIQCIYVLACLLAGIVSGKMGKNRRFLRGLFSGAAYCLLLFLISFSMQQTFAVSSQALLRTFLLCSAGGMIGGMIS